MTDAGVEQADAIEGASIEDRARELATILVGWPSVTGTPDEAAFPGRLADLLRRHPYFERCPHDIVIAPIPGDPLGRSNLLALVRGEGRRTVMLCGHFDVVPDEDYGDLAGLARSPDALRTALVQRLERTGSHGQALADLASGAFIPGRGMLDMKSGVAAGLAVLEHFASDPGAGNLLFVTTPDEEDRSAGMRAAATMLPAFLGERNLDVALAINLDATCDENDGQGGRIVAMGCLGKLLLSAWVVGKEAHAAYPFAGVNAAYLAAELVTELECAPSLAEISAGELAAPPTVLGLKDGKTLYNVTTPGEVWQFWNVLLHRRTGREVLDIARRHAEAAIARAAGRMQERALAVGQEGAAPAWSRAVVLSFAELMDHARRKHADFDRAFEIEAARLAEQSNLDLPERSRLLTRFAWAASGLEGPAIVLGFASMPYPAIEWPADGAALERAIDLAVEIVASETGVSIGKQRYYPAIADMSFVGPVDRDNLNEAARNIPVWGSSIKWSIAEAATPGIPIINIGPWGRDYHHWLERAHAHYAFGVLPRLLVAVTGQVLGMKPADERFASAK